MYIFCQFFKNLYEKPTLPVDRLNDLRVRLDSRYIDTDKLHDILDKEINLEELDSALKQLKAVSKQEIT